MAHVLVVDNHDSFVHTLVGYLTQLGAEVTMREADELGANLGELVTGYDGVMISPGPGTPQNAGSSIAVVEACARHEVPLFGVCLGHQAIAVAFGGIVSHAPELKHGMVSSITHDATGLFAELPSPLDVGRYHSLAIDPTTLPAELRATAATDAGVIMAVAHHTLPIVGVQFHPESVLTEHGYDMIANWLAPLGLPGARETARTLSARG